MESKLMLFSVLIGIVNAIPAPGHGALLGYCDTSSHCGVDECCVSFNQPRGRRTVLDYLDPNLMQYVHGSCQKLGTDGSKCFVHNMNTGTDGLYFDCPCAAGYTCDGQGTVEVPKGESGTCSNSVKVGRALRQPCSSGADCSMSECCVSNFQPIGKRGSKRQLAHGHCEPMGLNGTSCLVNSGSVRPDDVVWSCPCASSLTCKGLGFFEVPLGERGIFPDYGLGFMAFKLPCRYSNCAQELLPLQYSNYCKLQRSDLPCRFAELITQTATQ